jgi:uncharacterized repeat protein (TIGR01451 family)
VTIGDFVWNDTNQDGCQDAGELGIPGVKLTLTGTSGSGASITDHATTDNTGHYNFTEPPGTYTVTVDASNFASGGTLFGYTASPSLVPGCGTDEDSNGSPSGTTPGTLTSGGSDLTVDFGYFQQTGTPSLTLTKTADQTSITAGTKAGFTVTITNTGSSDASGLSLSDPLPPGADLNWTIDTTTGSPNNFQITGSAGSQSLVLTAPGTTLAAGTSESVHITSSTTNKDVAPPSGPSAPTSSAFGFDLGTALDYVFITDPRVHSVQTTSDSTYVGNIGIANSGGAGAASPPVQWGAKLIGNMDFGGLTNVTNTKNITGAV